MRGTRGVGHDGTRRVLRGAEVVARGLLSAAGKVIELARAQRRNADTVVRRIRGARSMHLRMRELDWDLIRAEH